MFCATHPGNLLTNLPSRLHGCIALSHKKLSVFYFFFLNLVYFFISAITPCHRCLSTQSSESLYMPEIRQRLAKLKLKMNLMLKFLSTNYFNSAEKFMNDQKSGQQSRKRRRLDSQCEICLNQLEQRLSTEMTTALFPEVLHKSENILIKNNNNFYIKLSKNQSTLQILLPNCSIMLIHFALSAFGLVFSIQ